MSGANPSPGDLTGSSFIALDSVRDASFLGKGGGGDFGLGVLDNPLFFFTSVYTPADPSVARLYPVKFFWIGSPLGTNDRTDKFGIYLADVVPENFYPGAAPNTNGTSWLVNPRLVLDPAQAKTDIVGWFDAHYPGGAVGGVGVGNSGGNGTYGTLAGGNSAVGNVSGVDSLDGQFWPIYDYVDNSVLLYFSVKTPNCNTLSIYCYKAKDTEFATPLSSQEFLGGLYAPGWHNTSGYFSSNAVLLSSHRFSILSPDPLANLPKPAGTQNAVFMYCYGVLNGASPDHGRAMACSVIHDLHSHPLNPGIAISPSGPPITTSINAEEFYTPDKLGSISAASSVDAPTPGYVCIFNSPSQIDRRSGTPSPVISAMQLRLLYYNPVAGISYGGDAVKVLQTPQTLGVCRPQFTNLPDGRYKMLFANFSWDQYLNLGYEYMSPQALSPKKQSKIRLKNYESGPTACYTYGKRKMLVRAAAASPSNDLSVNQNLIQIIGGVNYDSSNGFSLGIPPFVGSKFIHQEGVFSLGLAAYRASQGRPITEFTIEDLDPYVVLVPLGPGSSPIIEIDLVD